MNIGQQITHTEFGPGTVSRILSNGLISVDFEDGFNRYIHPKHGHVLGAGSRSVRRTASSNDITPSALSDAFVEHCRVAGIAINLQSPEHDMDRCRSILEGLGIAVPANFRPIQFGSRGGTIETHTFKLRAVTPLPSDPSIIPLKFTIKDGSAIIYNTPVLLGLLVAGFPITSCNEG